MQFQSDKIKSPKLILHNDTDHFLCYVRQKPIQALPEEVLRQKIVYYLHKTLHFPIETIGIEVPLSYFKKGQKGRADIVVYDKPLNKKPEPIILIECKAPGIPIDFRCEEQLNRYKKVINPDYGVLTNGNKFKVYSYRNNEVVERIPSKQDLISGKKIKVKDQKNRSWKRIKYHSFFKNIIYNRLVRKDIISPETDKDLTPILVKLIDLFYDTTKRLKTVQFDAFSVIEDCGLRFADYGYANSNGLLGNYRFFLLRHPSGNHQIISFSIYHQNDWGTYLMVGVDNRKGHSLELKLDKFIYGNSNKFQLWHDGSLTIGKKGRLKNKKVIDFISKNAPFLVENGKIKLGSLSADRPLYFDQPCVQDFLYRLSYYCLLREEIRKRD